MTSFLFRDDARIASHRIGHPSRRLIVSTEMLSPSHRIGHPSRLSPLHLISRTLRPLHLQPQPRLPVRARGSKEEPTPGQEAEEPSSWGTLLFGGLANVLKGPGNGDMKKMLASVRIKTLTSASGYLLTTVLSVRSSNKH